MTAASGPGPRAGWAAPSAGPAAPQWNAGVQADLRTAPSLGKAEPTSTRRYLKLSTSARGALVLAAFGTIMWMATGHVAFSIFTFALPAAVALDAWTAMRALRFERVELTPMGAAVADEPTRWQIHVEDLTRPVAMHAVRYPTPPDVLIDRSDPGVLVLPPTPRGVIHFIVVDVLAVGPIGFARAARRYRATPASPVVVGPRSLPIHIRWPMPRAVAYGLSEVAPRGDDLFRGVRPYQRGDERRKIHWKATARAGELMVREDDGTGIVALQVVVELGPPGPINEHIVANATWLATAAVQRGWRVQLVTVDDTPGVPGMPDLGSPFGKGPLTVPAGARAPQVLAQDVTDETSIRRQLATACPGTPPPPSWTGLTCRVTAHGVIWP
jgi:hypothetical protein